MNNKINIKEDDVLNLFNDSFTRLRYTDDKKGKYVYDNQINTAKEIIYQFYTEQNRWCLLFAEMQSGKSGTFFSVPYLISRNEIIKKKLRIDEDINNINVHLLTGMNETELINQFELDINGFTGMDLKKNVLHNSGMQNFLKKYNNQSLDKYDLLKIEKMRKNSLILIDESHYGSDKNQTLDKFLKNILKINPNGDNTELIRNNMYVVSISATPMAEFIQAELSEFKKKIIPLKNSEGYYGIVEMFNNNKVKGSFDLKSSFSINQMLDTYLNLKKDGYCIIRCSKTQKDKILDEVGKRLLNMGDPIFYDSSDKSYDQEINNILKEKPNKKTLIFIKGKLRAGKRLDYKKNVAMVHDTSVSKVDTTVQSLLGRFCGYGDINKDIEIYCDEISAKKYKRWVESGYDINKVPDKSKNVLSNRNKNLRIETLYHSKLFDVSNNFDIDYIMNKARKTKEDKIKVLELINDDDINKIIKDKILSIHYDIGSIFKVDQNKKNSSYKKQYEDVIKSGNFMGDIKEDKIREGQIIFSAAYEINTKNIVVSFGKVVESKTQTSEKSMYHESNKLSLLAQVDLENK